MSFTLPVSLIPLTWAFVGLVVFRILAAPYHENPAVWYGAQILGALIGFIGCAVYLKRRIFRVSASSFDVTPVQAGRFPGADLVSLTAETEALKALGFEAVMDYTTQHLPGSSAQGYGRLLYHRSIECYAEINQVFSPLTGMGPIGATLTTNFEGGWSFYCGNRSASGRNAAILYANRMPRNLFVILPGMPPANLLGVHLSTRDRLMRGMPQLRIVSQPVPDSYFSEMRKRQAARAASVERRSILVWLFDVDSYTFHRQHVWLGDYAKRFPRDARAITAAL